MSDLFASGAYLVPGVYTQEEITPLVTTTGLNPTIVGIIGPSIGHRTYTEVVVLNGTSNVRLSKLGINTASISVTYASNSTVAGPSDYVATAGSGDDADIGETADNTVDIRRAGSSTIPDGSTVAVSYEYTDAGYFDTFDSGDYDAIKDAFGEPFDIETGAILSPLSLAAKFAFDNGASRLVLLSTPGSATAVSTSDLADGYDKMMAIEEANILVPLTVGVNGSTNSPGDTGTVGTDLKNHVEQARQDGVYRIGILGFETGVTVDPTSLAGSIDSSRVVVAWPNRMQIYNGLLNQTREVGGYYLACAYAGRLASLATQIGLTRKPVRGFTAIPGDLVQTMTRSTKDAWSKAGVAVTEPNAQRGLIVRHGTSTDASSGLTREISITRAKDSLVLACRQAIENADLIGSAIVAETPANIKALIQGVLESYVDADAIYSYDALAVRQLTTDPSVIEVKFRYKPAFPLNYVLISFSIDPTAGTVTQTEDIAT